MVHEYWSTFVELIKTPFQHVALVWGIVPLYFALLLNEMTSVRASYRTAVQTGFSFLWSAAQWLYPYFRPHSPGGPRLELGAMPVINMAVTALVVVFGTTALLSGIFGRYPKYCAFLGYTRFSNYFMITIFPMQAPYLSGQHYLEWTWQRLLAIAIFAVPIWLVLHFGLMPIRTRK